MKRKMLAALLAGLLTFAGAACGEDDAADELEEPVGADETEPLDETEATETPT